MSKEDLERYLKMKQERSCCNCKFYDGLCCMYECACRAILHEDETAKKCLQFTLGEYDQDELEKSNYE
jgi:hypothetical protein